MNIDHIEAFVYSFHLGSFNKAAEVLYLTQPSVTARIKSLERQLDTTLFSREGNKITITEKGKHFLPYAQTILQSYREAKLELQMKQNYTTELTIACSLTVSNYIIPHLLGEFREKFPEVMLRILTCHSEQVLEKVTNNEAHFGMARSVTHPKVDTFLLHTDPLILVGPPSHHLTTKAEESITLEDISREPLICFDHDSFDWIIINRLFESQKLVPNTSLEVNSMETAKRLVMNGHGICFLPELCIKDELLSGMLKKIKIPSANNIARHLDLIYLKEEKYQPFFDFFTQFVDFQSKRLTFL